MKEHIMHLYNPSFDMIKFDIKNIEYRLNDEKRKLIKIGDMITFFLLPEDKEIIKVIVTDLKHYNNLLDMYTDNFDTYLKDNYKTPQDVVDDTIYYSQEEIDKYGCVAIFFKRL